MPTVIVSPCGTSLLTNDTDDSLRKLLNKTTNCKETELNPEQKEVIDKHIAERRERMRKAKVSEARKLSAELNGIITYYDGNPKGEHHILLATDTYLGSNTAKIVAEWLEQQKLKAIPKNINYLSTKDIESFRIALSEIVQWCNEELEKQYPRPYWTVVFNLTGGFKSVNGFLQAVAMFYADESIYIFESGSQLLKIPRLPLQLDPERFIGKHLQVFRRMAVLSEELNAEECKEIPETLLEQIDDRVALSEWGKLLWQKCYKQYYNQSLLPPLSKKLKYSASFEQVTNNLSEDRLLIINERLDQLSLYLESKDSNTQVYNPKSLDFKSLKGRPFRGRFSPEPTHECDAWSDRDAKRLYGHFDGNDYCIDMLGNHL
ncbi:putative CRISPR-associated protein [Nostocaceae cyanobacterium CENA369]|uniref:Putative CRISPR-associated protein n=1 Tax=Dendronalium phyllosphericum CENA369 TaxID=1725256 RepID=A0A8J7I8J5_9NOST|nr:putative CRISPR-associated protein [Dendronalium phyllosphericum]MBH8578086.1 putative CRISPR-associated protein [Dendronalium phyllosphericum CENA369]